MDAEVKQDMKEAKEKRSSNISMIDGKYMANFNVETHSEKDGYSYENYVKIFDTLKDYTDYLDKFLKL